MYTQLFFILFKLTASITCRTPALCGITRVLVVETDTVNLTVFINLVNKGDRKKMNRWN